MNLIDSKPLQLKSKTAGILLILCIVLLNCTNPHKNVSHKNSSVLKKTSIDLEYTPPEINPYESASEQERAQFKKTGLPLQPRMNFFIVQGTFGIYTHHGQGNEYAWDFNVPYGTPIVAIENGLVIGAWQPQKGGGCGKEHLNSGHNLKVRHKDGTVAQYVHLDIAVTVGQKVKRGQLLGNTSENGWICIPHLHLEVYQSDEQMYFSPDRKNIPLYFEGISGGLLKEGKAYSVPR